MKLVREYIKQRRRLVADSAEIDCFDRMLAELAEAKSESADSAKFYEWASTFYEKCCELDSENKDLKNLLADYLCGPCVIIRDDEIEAHKALRQRTRDTLADGPSERETHDNLMERLLEEVRKDPNYSRVCAELAGGWIKQSNGSSVREE